MEPASLSPIGRIVAVLFISGTAFTLLYTLWLEDHIREWRFNRYFRKKREEEENKKRKGA